MIRHFDNDISILQAQVTAMVTQAFNRTNIRIQETKIEVGLESLNNAIINNQNNWNNYIMNSVIKKLLECSGNINGKFADGLEWFD